MSDNGETSPGSCTHEEGEEIMVWGDEGNIYIYMIDASIPSLYFIIFPRSSTNTKHTRPPFVAAPSPKPNGTRKFTPHWGAARPQPSSRAYMVRKRFSDLKGGWGHKDHHHPRKYGLTWQSLRLSENHVDSCCICSPFFGGNDMFFPFDGVYVSILLGDY